MDNEPIKSLIEACQETLKWGKEWDKALPDYLVLLLERAVEKYDTWKSFRD